MLRFFLQINKNFFLKSNDIAKTEYFSQPLNQLHFNFYWNNLTRTKFENTCRVSQQKKQQAELLAAFPIFYSITLFDTNVVWNSFFQFVLTLVIKIIRRFRVSYSLSSSINKNEKRSHFTIFACHPCTFSFKILYYILPF